MDETVDYQELKATYKKLQLELEQKNQILYDHQRQIKQSLVLETAYQEEIKILQTQTGIEENKLQNKVKQLEESLSSLKLSKLEKITELESLLIEKEHENQKLKSVQGIKPQADEVSIDETVFDELVTLKENNFKLRQDLCDLELCLEEKNKQAADYLSEIKHLKENLENYVESLNCTREELSDAKDVIQTLRDDLISTKSALETLQAQPLDDKSRGNSLFAEVDDRRVQLQENMKIMKRKYTEMKQERLSLLQEITTLRNQNVTLIAQWEADVAGEHDDNERVIDGYKNSIQTLNSIIESYKKEIADTNRINTNDNDFKMFEKMLSTKKNEINQLREELQQNTFNYTTESRNLVSANKDIRKLKVQNLQLQNEIDNLKTQIKEMEVNLMKNLPSPEAEQDSISVLKDKNNYETEKSKKVHFSEDTLDRNVTNRKQYKQFKKTLTSEPRKY